MASTTMLKSPRCVARAGGVRVAPRALNGQSWRPLLKAGAGLWRVQASQNKWEEPVDPCLEGLQEGCPVPYEQQPIHELRALQDTFLFDYATMPLPQYVQRLAVIWGGFMLGIGMPVSAVTFDLVHEPVPCVVSASIGSLFIVVVLVWRLYLGWDHVGSRLLSATVEYEETGWYDGQVWVKTPQVLMRDRLQNSYTVRPALARLRRTLLGLGGALAASVVVLASVAPPQADASGSGLSWSEYQQRQAALGAAVADGGAPALQQASAAAAAADGNEYWDKVAEFEPWALEEGEGGSSVRPSLAEHIAAAR